jgi:HK97 family phage major capsid protein
MQELRADINARVKKIKKEAKDAHRDLDTRERQIIAEGEAMVVMLAGKIEDERSRIGGELGKGGAETPTSRNAVLGREHRYSDWLAANWAREDVSEGRAWPSQWDHEATQKYYRGMMTGSWKNAEAEQRAAMNEGTSTQGGYLVPAPVAAEYVDVLRDQIVFMMGKSHTVPWGMGSTLSLPVATADPAVQNLSEGVESYPPPSDATISRYQFVARPYFSVETFSWELAEDSAVDIADMVQLAMAKRMSVAIQSDFIYGAGANTIQGYTLASGLLTGVEGGSANGTAPGATTGYNYVDIGIEACRSARVSPDMIVTSPRAYQSYGRLKNTLNDALTPSPTVQDFLTGRDGKACYLTTAVKDTQTVGTATADCSDLFVLDSSRIYWAIKHDYSVLSLSERFATQRQWGLIGWLRLDAVLTHAEGAYWLKGIVGS